MRLLRNLLLSGLLLCINIIYCNAQYKTTIPLSNSIKHGVLSNGMNYYILHNEEPKERVSFYFVQNVGAILEQDNQDGFSNILEHMAFNGLEHYPGKSMLDYLEQKGVQYGKDISAYTARDETIYNISNLPANNENLIDSTFLILYDWSNGLLLEDKAIDEERNSIRKEWKTKDNSQQNLLKQIMQDYYNDSKYAKRDIIGSPDVINNFKYQELRDYYHKWFRPDLQSLIVVGDIDTNKIEEKIKTLFSKISARKNKAERKYYPIEDSKEMSYVVAKDKDAQQINISLIFRRDPSLIKDEKYLGNKLAQAMLKSMLNIRFKELCIKDTCEASDIQLDFFELGRKKNAAYFSVIPKEQKINEAFRTLITEIERATKFGFTDSELERIKSSFLYRYESYYKEKDKISNDSWALQIADFFLKAEPLPDSNWETNFVNKTIPDISSDEIQELLKLYYNINNSSLSITGPDDPSIKYPTKEELLQIVQSVKETNVNPWQSENDSIPLINDELYEAKILEKAELPDSKAQLYVLENGAKIILYPTDNSNDEVLFNAYSFGGVSVVPDKQLASANLSVILASLSGAGEFDAIQLQKKLSGKIAYVTPNIESYTEGFSGSSSVRDFESMLKLLYLKFIHPRFDKDTYKNIVENLNDRLSLIQQDNNQAFSDTISMITSNYNSRNLILNKDFIDNLNFEQAIEVYKDRMKDASDFTFIFVGNVDNKEDLSLIQKYIGSIPSIHRSETWINHNIKPAKGLSQKTFQKEMDVPEVSVFYALYNNMDYNIYTRTMVRFIANFLETNCIDRLKEVGNEKYKISVTPNIQKLPYEHSVISIKYDCSPEKEADLLKIIENEMQNLINNGPDINELQELKEKYIINREKAEKQNSFWLDALTNSQMYNESIINKSTYNSMINKIKKNDVRKFAKKIFKNTDAVKIVMRPQNK